MIRFLDELGISNKPASPARFSARLVELLDLPKSVKISLVHTGIRTMEFEPFDNSADRARIELMRVHGEVTDTLVQSFAPKEGFTRLNAPAKTSLHSDSAKDPQGAIAPYRKFYVYYQRMLESRVNQLREATRDTANGLSLKLAQLASLDKVLGDTLMQQDRQSFGKVPVLLEKRFSEQLLSAAPNQLTELHSSFCLDMKALLLAEFELRLLPVLGLIETIEVETIEADYA